MNRELAQKVAQLMVLGYEGAAPGPVAERFIGLGLGGIIFFRDNFDSLQPLTPYQIAETLFRLQESWPRSAPLPFFSIDQEGGQVERLPHTVFPTAVNPLAVANASDPEAFAETMYAGMAERLALLGFNMDFFPTLDVNLNPANPIIGVRSFGHDPETVSRLGQVALRAFSAQGVMPVIKHFPGHGNGTVDSHYDLPVLAFTEEELAPFREAVGHGCPAVLVAHGFYPALQTAAEERNRPSSASKTIVEGLLRRELGFDGLVVTDDMCMGAITRHVGPEEAAIRALEAGVDILLYKQSTESEWRVLEAVVAAYESGRLDLRDLEASLERIQRAKAGLKRFQPDCAKIDALLGEETVRSLAEEWAERGLSVQAGNIREMLPLEGPILLVYPQRMGNYAFDLSSSPDLPAFFSLPECYGFRYVHTEPYLIPELMPADVATVVLLTFNPQLHAGQVELAESLRERYPRSRLVTVAVGMPNPPELTRLSALDILLGSYRPAGMQALARLLQGQLQPA